MTVHSQRALCLDASNYPHPPRSDSTVMVYRGFEVMDCVRLTNPMCTWPFEAVLLSADLRNICSGLTFFQKAEYRTIPRLDETQMMVTLSGYVSPQVLTAGCQRTETPQAALSTTQCTVDGYITTMPIQKLYNISYHRYGCHATENYSHCTMSIATGSA